MKDKTSITLSREVLASIDRLARSTRSRSALIEAILREFLGNQARAKRHARDLELINQAADSLNAEAADFLKCQAPKA